MAQQQTSAPADRCILEHRVFTAFGDPLFRLAETDGTPAMVVMLGDKEAAIQLRSLRREFGIPDDSEDGRMLDLIAQALDFVAGLRIGDALPAEVLTGEASWQPDETHLQIANARLQWQLVAWLNSGTGAQAYRGDGSHLKTLTQVRRLTAVPLKQIGSRFEELDAQTGEVMAALRNADTQRAFIRENRDWLHRTQRAWHLLLQELDMAGIGFDEGILLLLNRSYQFLAPCFMPVTEWTVLAGPGRRKKEVARQMVW